MITSAKYINDYTLELDFKNGKKAIHDFGDEIKNSANGLIRDFVDLKKFKRVKVRDVSLVWPGNIFDIHGPRPIRCPFWKTKKKDSFVMDIVAAKHISDYKVKLTFSNGIDKVVDFKKRFDKYAPSKWRSLNKFVKFKVEDGNIVWGKDWDVIFKVSNLYRN